MLPRPGGEADLGAACSEQTTLVVFERMFYNMMARLCPTTALPEGLIAVSYHEQIATSVNTSPASRVSEARALETSQGQTGWATDAQLQRVAPRRRPSDWTSSAAVVEAVSEEHRLLLDFWDAQRADGLVPKRAMIEPGRIKHLLPFLLIMEQFSMMEARIRLAGTALRDLFGFEASGQNYIELAPLRGRRERSYRMWQITHHPCGGRYTRGVTFPNGLREICDGLLLPLAPDHPDRPPLAIVAEIPRHGRRWQNQARPALLEPVDDFAFVDVGAGTPELAVPTDWP